MRKLIAIVILGVLVAVIAIPTLLVRGWDLRTGPQGGQPGKPPAGEVVKLKVFVVEKNKIEEMALEDYLRGVVAAEMPAEFHPEALKAQAIAARTYTVKHMKAYGGKGCALHPDADVCTDPKHCQAWISDEEMLNRWGAEGVAKYKDKIARAVQDTAGYVITYAGELIDPVYSSTCGGRTENAEDVWGTKVPYLQSVVCTTDGHSTRLKDTAVFSLEEFAAKLGIDAGAVPVMQGEGNGVMQVLERTGTGRIKKLSIDDKVFDAADVRSKLNLRSTNFTWSVEGDTIKINTTGYGHGVGMCQYGADGMAKAGKTAIEILQYYYTGVQVDDMFAK